MTDSIPYTHWAYFTDRDAADECGRELDTRFDCLTAVDPCSSPHACWLLRAARGVDPNAPGGWHEFTSLNDGNSSLNLEIWHGKPQHGEVRFLIEVCSPSAVFTVGAVDAADMMDLVTRWAPTVQAAAFTDLCREMDFGQAVNTNMETNRFAAIGALMAEGSAQRESWEARAVRRTQERLAAARARRESGQ